MSREARQNPSLLRKRIFDCSSIFATKKFLNVSQRIHLRFFSAAKIKYQSNLPFLATGRFCIASLGKRGVTEITLRSGLTSKTFYQSRGYQMQGETHGAVGVGWF
jgi:hypothetical protein